MLPFVCIGAFKAAWEAWAEAMDFDDLLVGRLNYFQKSLLFWMRIQERFRYINVDEYQIPTAFSTRAAFLASKYKENLMVVGDD